MKTIKVVEAARNNFPDAEAVLATQQIHAFAGTLTPDDVLFVLITGGGSALLPLPAPGITLAEKLEVIGGLVRSGATINELNEVRIQLSAIKGGQLAGAAAGAKQIVSLIISDIVHDPIELIASGPTVQRWAAESGDGDDDNNNGRRAVDILRAHGLWDALSDNVQQAAARANTMTVGGGKVENILIANNSLAVEGCLRELGQTGGTRGVYLSNAVVGDVGQVAEGYFELSSVIKEAMRNKRRLTEGELRGSLEKLSIEGEGEIRLIGDLNEALLSGGDVCLVAGGETTVRIRGHGGVGGRNQQMVLEFMKLSRDGDVGGVYLLSAGTDGIDGPTDAAGAIGGLEILRQQFETKEALGIEGKIAEKDSYNFFRGKECHLVIGQTGTNVMDIQLLMICK